MCPKLSLLCSGFTSYINLLAHLADRADLNGFFFLPDSWDFKQSTRNISPTINQANIVDLHPASVYSIRMYSFNKIGRSEPSKELTVSTEEAGTSCLPGAAVAAAAALRRGLFLFCALRLLNPNRVGLESVVWERGSNGCIPPLAGEPFSS